MSPAEWTVRNIEHMRQQMLTVGLRFDWDRVCANIAHSRIKAKREHYQNWWAHILLPVWQYYAQ